MIENQLYREELLERARNPTHAGVLSPADIKQYDTNPLCGDSVLVTAKVKDNRIKEILFKGEGCALSIASGSLLCELVIGKTIKSIIKLERKDMEALIGVAVSISRVKCIMLTLIALKKGMITCLK